MSADVLSDLLRVQQRSNRQALTVRFDPQFAAAKFTAELAARRIQMQTCGPIPQPKNKPIDALNEWSRWERDILAFEPRL